MRGQRCSRASSMVSRDLVSKGNRDAYTTCYQQQYDNNQHDCFPLRHSLRLHLGWGSLASSIEWWKSWNALIWRRRWSIDLWLSCRYSVKGCWWAAGIAAVGRPAWLEGGAG